MSALSLPARPQIVVADTPERVAVVGAGVAGLAAAVRLAESGHPVAVYDPSPSVGGLAGGFSVGGTTLERYYHHVFRSDTVAHRWIDEMGLRSSLEFLPAGMGFYSGGRLHRFGTPLSLLSFTPLSVVDRVRLGLRIRELASASSPEAFEDVAAVDWLSSRASAAEMRIFWLPLLRAKFGVDAERVSMAWLWARFRARVGGSPLRRERLGYMRGGFQQLADRMTERARGLGVDVVLGARVLGVEIDGDVVRGLHLDPGGTVEADAVVWTPSLNVLPRAATGMDKRVADVCAAITYHAAVVVVVELNRSALPHYWVTIGDPSLPFTVAVEHTRLVDAADYGGRSIVYLGRYAAPGDPLLRMSDIEIAELFTGAAARALSDRFAEPAAVHVFRASAAQPIVPPGWAGRRPPLRGAAEGLVLANMAQIYPWDRGINYSLALGEEAARAVEAELETRRRRVRLGQ